MENVTDPDTFNKELGTLIGQISAQAVETKNGGLGKGKTKLSTFVTLYALVQCTRDLSLVDCAQCLAIAVAILKNFAKTGKDAEFYIAVAMSDMSSIHSSFLLIQRQTILWLILLWP